MYINEQLLPLRLPSSCKRGIFDKFLLPKLFTRLDIYTIAWMILPSKRSHDIQFHSVGLKRMTVPQWHTYTSKSEVEIIRVASQLLRNPIDRTLVWSTLNLLTQQPPPPPFHQSLWWSLQQLHMAVTASESTGRHPSNTQL